LIIKHKQSSGNPEMANSLVSANRQQNGTRIQFSATLDVANAAALKKELGKALRRKSPFDLDGSAIDRVDAAGLQILTSFIAETRRREKEVRWVAASNALKSASRISGLAANLVLDD
jgi:anti-anti-sigma factor